jgi:zinc finger protein ZIC 1
VHSHTGYKPFPCPSCTQAFVTKDQLDKHVTTHTGAKDFVCSWPGCDRSFAVKHALDGHVNSVHLKAKKHICPHCSQAFDDSSNLSKHKKQVHHPDTGIKCPARHTHGCMYVDSRKDKMKEHCERHRHGLETVTDPHAWAFWVQQFRSTSKKAESRRSSRPISRASSLLSCTTTASTTLAAAAAAAVPPDCDSQACTLPVCHHPCTLLCHDLFPAHDPFSQPCDADDCDGLEPCTDDPCTDPHCDFSQYPCDLWHPPCDLPPSSCPAPPCNMPVCPPQCRSATSTPSSVPHTPYESARDSSSSSLYSYGDTFHGTEHPFHMQPADEYMFMNQ